MQNRDMKANYFIGVRIYLDGTHVVHREGCPLLPTTSKMIFLGMFDSPNEALYEGKLLYKKINCCLFFCKDHYDLKRETDFS